MFTVFQIVVFLFSVVLHEVAHGAAANAMGDNTAKDLGRLTLNPVKHIDLFGSIVLPLLAYLGSAGTFVFGYAKPVPYNPNNLNDRRFGPAKVAFAGPAVNLVLAVVFGLIIRFLPSSLGATLPTLLGYIVWVNLLLAVFNLMPIPPLDGHWLLLTFLPASANVFKLWLVRYGMVLFVFFLFFIFPQLLPLINLLFRIIVG